MRKWEILGDSHLLMKLLPVGFNLRIYTILEKKVHCVENYL